MAKRQDYIEFSIRENYNEQLEYLEKFNLTSHNIKRFEDKISAIVSSIDTEIRSSVQHTTDLQESVDEQVKKPEMKTLTDDPWYKVYKVQSGIVKYLIRAGAFKTWMAKFLIVSNNKMSEFLDNINESLVDLKKVELQSDMYKQMYENLQDIKKVQDAQGAPANKEYEEQIGLLTEQISGQKEVMSSITNQLQSFTSMVNELQKNQKPVLAPDKPIPEEEIAADKIPDVEDIIGKKEADVLGSFNNIEEIEDDEDIDDDDDTTTIIDTDAPPMFSEEVEDKLEKIDSTVEEEVEEEPKIVNKGIEFDDFEDEIDFFNMVTRDLNFKDTETESLMFFIETAEDLERELNINRKDVDTKEKKTNFLGQLAFVHNNYVYSKSAVQDFLGYSQGQLKIWCNKMGVLDKINWDE